MAQVPMVYIIIIGTLVLQYLEILFKTVHYFISEMIILFGKHQVLLIGKTDQPSDNHEQNVCQE